MGYENWMHKHLSPSSIELDSKNPRLPNLPSDASQADIRLELLNTCKVKEMARSISDSGFYPDQTVVVIRKEGSQKFIVVEGNRRVCACQLLLKPKLAPEKYSRVINRYSVQGEPYVPSFKKIPVVIAPDRLAAVRLVASRHLNKAPVIGWSRYAQGRFAINAFDDGQSMSEIMEETGLSAADIRSAIQDSRLIDLFMGLDWSQQEKDILYDSVDKFPVEGLRRILTNSVTREKFGSTSFDDDGWLVFEWDESIVKSVLKRFMYDAMPSLKGGGEVLINSRTINSIKTAQDYYDKHFPEGISGSGSIKKTNAKNLVDTEDNAGSDGNGPGGSNKGKNTAKKEAKPKAARKTRTPALPRNFNVALKNDKVLVVLEELQAIYPENFPYATALLLRSLLEVSLLARMKHMKVWSNCILEYKKGDKNELPSLDNMLKFSVKCEKTIPDPSLRASLSNTQVVPKKLFKFVAHNDQHIFTSTEARDAANKMLPLFRSLLETND